MQISSLVAITTVPPCGRRWLYWFACFVPSVSIAHILFSMSDLDLASLNIISKTVVSFLARFFLLPTKIDRRNGNGGVLSVFISQDNWSRLRRELITMWCTSSLLHCTERRIVQLYAGPVVILLQTFACLRRYNSHTIRFQRWFDLLRIWIVKKRDRKSVV